MTTNSNAPRLARLIGGALLMTLAAPAWGTICVVPDNGSGTADLPPSTPSAGCTTGYVSPTDFHMIIAGLPPGTTIQVGAEHNRFLGVTSMPGGSLGGEKENFESSLTLVMTGTGALTYNRTVAMNNVIDETHIGPRTPGSPTQSFDTVMFGLQGQLPPGDPDFDLLRITAGTGFGMPSPGHTTLTKMTGGQWNVDSFFDIEYRIDFVGAAGGPFAGRSGSTTGTIRMQAGAPAVYDHLECFKMKDAIKLVGLVDLPSLAGGTYDATGCRIGKAKKYCTPVGKVVTESIPAATPFPGPGLTSDYICYSIKCPKVALTQGVQDQFGARTLVKLSQKELCVPAQKTP